MKRTRLVRHKPLRATQPMARTRGGSTDTRDGEKVAQRPVWPARRRDTGPTKKVRDVVMARDGGRCVRCGVPVTGLPHSLQHRRARGAGGTTRPDTNLPANLILVCGTGTSLCHGRIERKRHEAQGFGWAIPLAASCPADWSVWTADRGRIYLDDDGSWRPA